jgi:hypothetical protein
MKLARQQEVEVGGGSYQQANPNRAVLSSDLTAPSQTMKALDERIAG